MPTLLWHEVLGLRRRVPRAGRLVDRENQGDGGCRAAQQREDTPAAERKLAPVYGADLCK